MYSNPASDQLRLYRKELRSLLRQIHDLPGPDNWYKRHNIWLKFVPLAAAARQLAAHSENGHDDPV